jgi:hypothetical protein
MSGHQAYTATNEEDVVYEVGKDRERDCVLMGSRSAAYWCLKASPSCGTYFLMDWLKHAHVELSSSLYMLLSISSNYFLFLWCLIPPPPPPRTMGQLLHEQRKRCVDFDYCSDKDPGLACAQCFVHVYGSWRVGLIEYTVVGTYPIEVISHKRSCDIYPASKLYKGAFCPTTRGVRELDIF